MTEHQVQNENSAQLSDEPTETLLYNMAWHETSAPIPRPLNKHWTVLGAQDNGLAGAIGEELARRVPAGSMRFGSVYTPLTGGAVCGNFALVLDSARGDSDWSWAGATIGRLRELANCATAQVWIVTSSGVLGPASGTARPEQMFSWGLGRSLATETPDLIAGLIDVDRPAAASNVVDIFSAGGIEDEWLVRRGRFLIPRLQRLPSGNARPASLSRDRLHLISGGLLGVSGFVAEGLASRGAAHLLIVGNSEFDEQRALVLDELRRSYASVEYLKGDISDSKTISQIELMLSTRKIRLGGIFHLAANWRLNSRSAVGPISTLSPEYAEAVIGAKAGGAIRLAELSITQDAELFVLFSTAAAILGSPGQSNYAAASAVLDGAAAYASHHSCHAVSISWGPLADIGFGADARGSELHRTWKRLGIQQVASSELLALMDAAIATRQTSVMACRLDVAAVTGLPWISKRPVFSIFHHAIRKQGALVARLNPLPRTDWPQVICDVLQNNLATIIHADIGDVSPRQPLVDQGIDSLIALEFLFTIERDFGVNLPFNEAVLSDNVTLESIAIDIAGRIPNG